MRPIAEAVLGGLCGLALIGGCALGGAAARGRPGVPPAAAPSLPSSGAVSASPPVGQGPAAVVEAPPAVVPAPTGTARLRDALRPAPVLLDAAWPSPSAAYAVGDADFGSEAAGDCSSSGGVLCPQGGFILASAAGGRSWRKAYQGSAALLGIQAWPSGGAVAWGPEALVGSTDGGRTWRPLSVPGPGWIVAASFASASDGWVTVQDGSVPPNFGKDAVFATADGGRTWREIARTNAYPRQEPGALVLGALGVSGAYIGDGEGWLDADPAIVTRDDGVTWTKLPQADQPPSGVADVAVDLSRGFRLDYASAPGAPIATDVQQTVDGGATWATLAEVGEALSGLRRAGDGSLWAVAIPTDEVDRRVGTPRWACGPSAPACGPAVWVGTGGGRAWAARSMAGLDPTVVAPSGAPPAGGAWASPTIPGHCSARPTEAARGRSPAISRRTPTMSASPTRRTDGRRWTAARGCIPPPAAGPGPQPPTPRAASSRDSRSRRSAVAGSPVW
jgi:photosystem II stability/assembly factor-like uncharacterized protein